MAPKTRANMRMSQMKHLKITFCTLGVRPFFALFSASLTHARAIRSPKNDDLCSSRGLVRSNSSKSLLRPNRKMGMVYLRKNVLVDSFYKGIYLKSRGYQKVRADNQFAFFLGLSLMNSSTLTCLMFQYL